MVSESQHEILPTFDDCQSHAGHVPVLLDEVMSLLAPRNCGRYIDATFGGGGHTRAILEQSAPEGRILALDADPEAIARATKLAQSFPGRLAASRGNFRDIVRLARTADFAPVDGILMDLGLSSFQLDQPERGFSFRFSAPLDMRFDVQHGPSAATIVNEWDETDLANLIFEYGEEPRSRAIARIIVAERRQRPIETTDRLASIVECAVGGRRGRAIHPATRTFQALRIAVNDELGALREGLAGALELLASGGRLVVISFHSLEDRIVKIFMRDEATECICPPGTPICICDHRAQVRLLTRRAVRPSEAEERRNPRSRSAKLRAVERLP
ncbi:MAG TPA: 16S rRNA (cytosine(1402)-N(4))-methyltransferase RsmH [Nitrolancea sp.]|nr:16S rRNA (cytosine(1402)-N(4))-methyltransferase RsmH [Nitrolancea sp.]